MREFFPGNFPERMGILHTVARDVKYPNLSLLGESKVGNVGQKAVKYTIHATCVSIYFCLNSDKLTK